MKKLLILLIFGLSLQAFAQQLPFGSLYYTNMLSLNPAYTGFNPETEIFLSHRSQFVGFQNSPQTNFLSATGNMSEKVGIGLTAYADNTALFRKSSIMANYAYSLKFAEKQFLHFGLGAGINSVGLDMSNAQTADINDPIFGTVAQNKMGFNADFGLLYQMNALEIGFSVPQIFNNATVFYLQNDQKYTYRNTTHFRGSAKYDFFFGKESIMKVYPMLMMRYVQGAPVQYDLSAVFDHRKWGWVGVTYHSDFAIAASAGIRYKNLGFGYAHDFILGPLRRLGKFSSEFVLSYRFEDKQKADKRDWSIDKEKNESEAKKNEAPTDEELNKLRAEVEKLRREKAAMEDSLQRSNQLKGEEQLLQTEEKRTSPQDTMVPQEKTQPEVPLTKKQARKKKRAERRAKRKGIVLEEEGENTIVETVKPVEKPVEEKPILTKIDKEQLVFQPKENYETEAGETPDEGFYIILGAFADPKNTKRFVSILEEYEFENIQVIRNKEKNLDEVCVYFSGNIGETRKVLLEYRAEGRKSWILNLK